MHRLLLLLAVCAVLAGACSTAELAGTTTSLPALDTTTTPASTTSAAVTTSTPTTSTTAAPTTAPPDAATTSTLTPAVGSGDAVDGPGTYERSIIIDDIDRRYVLHIGEGADVTEGVALVLDLHGLSSNPESQDDLSGFRAKADTEGFVVAQPQADGIVPTWQAGFSPSTDVGFLRSIIEDVSAFVDVGPVFAAGFSNGAGMAHRFACDAPEEVVAIGTVAGAYPDSGPCEGSVPVVTFHGVRDPVVPFLGAGFLLPEIAEWADSWAIRAGCGDPVAGDFADGVELRSWQACPDGMAVDLYVVTEGRHGWPGTASRSRLFNSTSEISATDIMWEFFLAAAG